MSIFLVQVKMLDIAFNIYLCNVKMLSVHFLGGEVRGLMRNPHGHSLKGHKGHAAFWAKLLCSCIENIKQAFVQGYLIIGLSIYFRTVT